MPEHTFDMTRISMHDLMIYHIACISGSEQTQETWLLVTIGKCLTSCNFFDLSPLADSTKIRDIVIQFAKAFDQFNKDLMGESGEEEEEKEIDDSVWGSITDILQRPYSSQE